MPEHLEQHFMTSMLVILNSTTKHFKPEPEVCVPDEPFTPSTLTRPDAMITAATTVPLHPPPPMLHTSLNTM
ncbi:hypothetical protein E2C01_005301 [Portunus trituberculatus]|uniref:Uncharacterized protein n=1 Tax=Portunus trituberculatus TaxID=210409 RepID=A0A5B7CTX1_PORTR|nr:hypothetical protein [Portunus trituberculatus]